MAQTPQWLVVRHLTVPLGGQAVLQDLSFSVSSGVQLITGDEGSGKTTLARTLAGMQAVKKGTATVQGQPLTLAKLDNGVLLADAVVAESQYDLTGEATWDRLRQQWKDFHDGAMQDLLALFGLEEHMAKPLFQWSTGSRRKLGLCAAFAAGAPLAVLDTPYAALDARSCGALDEVLQDLADHPHRCWLLLDHEPPAGLGQTAAFQLP
ncbi:ATP-binding cassette domain-containing protein [Hydrogenophaga sp. 5NK40-0174]|uniref:ABC transporter ATP-binding protein n=1 Tax=Hydrogenophaga sp. 5NK40-0174 TaxID=3127649 RepID=UPI0031097B69